MPVQACEISWRASLSGNAQNALGKGARASINGFFEHFPEPLETEVIIFTVKTGVGGQELLKQNKTFGARLGLGKPVTALPVSIHVEGTQCVEAVMSIRGRSEAQVAEIVGGGPYNRKPKAFEKKLSTPPPLIVSNLPQSISVETKPLQTPPPSDGSVDNTPVDSPSEVGGPKVLTVSSEKPREVRPPREILLERGVSNEAIARLKETLSALLFDAFNGKPIDPRRDNLVVISVENISEAAVRYMRLPKNKKDDYQGIIGSFYSTRLNLFGFKMETATDPSARYNDWMIDCCLVLDFVGGNDSLAALARVYKDRIKEIEKEEAISAATPAPSPEEVKEAVDNNNGFMEDMNILAMVANLLADRSKALDALVAAQENLSIMQTGVDNALRALEEARAQVKKAEGLVSQAEQVVTAKTLSPELTKKLQEIRGRMNAVFDRAFNNK